MKEPIKTIGMVVRRDRPPKAMAIAVQLSAWIRREGLAPIADVEIASAIGADPVIGEDLVRRADLLVVLGGDGTLLGVAREVGALEKPILGINLGGLGFLTEVSTDEAMGTLARIVAGDYAVDGRIMLQAAVHRDGTGEVEEFSALNDVVFVNRAVGRMLELEVVANHIPFCTYRADGLIIATPTGSTAYALSAGGPIVYPSLRVIVLAPICPHTLSNRPVLLPDSFELKIRVKTDDKGTMLTCDGQESASIGTTDTIIISRGKFTVRLIRSTHPSFEIWRDKLHWG
ncbi:MAG: NAD(+)/NADH kinase [Deltaproteobacteria bacterium]|nr:NAD(+)/NADH kinase [Deltaproteobacteria bacterium]